MSEAAEIDWGQWLARWDRQQDRYLPDREEKLGLLLEVVERVVGSPRRLVDLGCGPGSLAVRAARRFPAAQVVGVDLDPFLLELGAQAVASQQVQFRAADLRTGAWASELGAGLVDAVCSATAIHYLEPTEFDGLAKALADLIRPGGVFVSIDTHRLGPGEVPRLDEVAIGLRNHLWDGELPESGEGWAEWWSAARAEPAFADLIDQRDRMFSSLQAEGAGLGLSEVLAGLRRAGFAEVGVLAQYADKHLVTAIR